jgi:hypothetical protein
VERGAWIVEREACGVEREEELSPHAPRSTPHDANGTWLYHAAVKRGVLEWFQSFGTDHGYPSNMTKWSRGMVALAVEARRAATKGAVK